jgi:manganese/iron transport system ATP-binding protein
MRLFSGTATILGETVTPKNVRHLRQRIGYVSQFRSIDARQPITVFESVLSGIYGRLGLFRKPGSRERALAMDALHAIYGTHLASRPLGHLSGDEAQRVAIARALAQEPKLLLLDEPTASLDWQARRDILHLIGTLRSDLSLTVLMVTHELNALPDLCDSVLFIKNGSVIWQGGVIEGLTEARLSEAFDTPVTVLSHNEKPVVLV